MQDMVKMGIIIPTLKTQIRGDGYQVNNMIDKLSDDEIKQLEDAISSTAKTEQGKSYLWKQCEIWLATGYPIGFILSTIQNYGEK